MSEFSGLVCWDASSVPSYQPNDEDVPLSDLAFLYEVAQKLTGCNSHVMYASKVPPWAYLNKDIFDFDLFNYNAQQATCLRAETAQTEKEEVT
ncbi:jg21485 [Pararge aegeria aegeria]|uniref:Jg21485 protein n=1 Tax=Pararge aegeria aegeria TaxID=348720 RepID=A0A8S4RQX4_9NEOP|nr:jg21485 [Pararge aegeria aegeria]